VDKISLARIEYLEKELQSSETSLKSMLQEFHEKEYVIQNYEVKISNLETGMSEKNMLIQEFENKLRAMERLKQNEKQSEVRIQLLESELNEKNQQNGEFPPFSSFPPSLLPSPPWLSSSPSF
jgi:chromosome segregation ATPase